MSTSCPLVWLRKMSAMSLSRAEEAWEAWPGDDAEACEGDLAWLEGVQEGSAGSPGEEEVLEDSTLCVPGPGGFTLSC